MNKKEIDDAEKEKNRVRRAYRAANSEKIKTYQAAYRAANREEIKASQAVYRAAKKSEAAAAMTTTGNNHD